MYQKDDTRDSFIYTYEQVSSCHDGIPDAHPLVAPVSSNQLSDLNLTNNQTNGNLSTTFTQQVADSTTHSLKNVKVSLNGNETNSKDYTLKPIADIFTYVYPLNVTPTNSNYKGLNQLLYG